MLTNIAIWFVLENSGINCNTSPFHIQKSPKLSDKF